MGPVAERLLPRGATPTQGNTPPATQVYGTAFRVNQLEVPLDPEASVVIHRDSAGHDQS